MFMTAPRPRGTAADPPRGSSPAWGGPALGLVETASMRRSSRTRHHDDAVLIRIKPFARAHPDAVDLQHDVAVALVALLGRQRHQGERADADLGLPQLGAVSHAAVHDDAGPAV